MLYLNMVENSEQATLFTYLPKLYEYLKNKNMETRQDFDFPWKHVEVVKTPMSSNLDTYILAEMSMDAAKVVATQCEREFWSDEIEGQNLQRYIIYLQKKRGIYQLTIEWLKYILQSVDTWHHNRLPILIDF